jgi:hypothetical protein
VPSFLPTALDNYTSQVDRLDLGDRIILCKIEPYSCKRAGADRRLFKQIVKELNTDISIRKREGRTCETGLGDISQPATQKLLVSLITALNASFPDYDFSSLDADCFRRVPVSAVTGSLDTEVLAPAESLLPGIRAHVTGSIMEAIDVHACDAFMYIPSPDSPLFAGRLWAFTYFLHCPAQKRVLLVSCAGRSKLNSPALLPLARRSAEDEDDEEWEEEEEALAQALWASEDEEEEEGGEAIVETDMLDLEDFTDQGFLPDSTWMTPSMQPIATSNSSGKHHTLNGKPSPFLLPTEQAGTLPDLPFI